MTTDETTIDWVQMKPFCTDLSARIMRFTHTLLKKDFPDINRNHPEYNAAFSVCRAFATAEVAKVPNVQKVLSNIGLPTTSEGIEHLLARYRNRHHRHHKNGKPAKQSNERTVPVDDTETFPTNIPAEHYRVRVVSDNHAPAPVRNPYQQWVEDIMAVLIEMTPGSMRILEMGSEDMADLASKRVRRWLDRLPEDKKWGVYPGTDNWAVITRTHGRWFYVVRAH